MEDDMHRWIAGSSGLFHNYFGVSSVQDLLQTCEKPADAFALCRDEPVGLVAGHGAVIYREGHEEEV